MTDPLPLSPDAIAADLARLGIAAGDLVMVHAACRAVGPVMGGPDGIIAGLRRAVGPDGTIMAYLDWEAAWEDFIDADGRVPDVWRPHVVPFDPARTRAARDNGALAEFLRTTPGALRSLNPGASVTALGPLADAITRDHPLNYGYGPGSPLARLVERGGKVLMLGAPWDTMTLLHHAEHLARLPSKTIIRREIPFARPDGGIDWRWMEEFDTSEPVSDRLPENFIEQIVTDYLATGAGRRDMVGAAPSILVDAADILPFAIKWLERTAS